MCGRRPRPTRPLVGQQTFASPWRKQLAQSIHTLGGCWLPAWQSIHIGICLSSHIAAQRASGLSQGTRARGAAVKISIAPFGSLARPELSNFCPVARLFTARRRKQIMTPSLTPSPANRFCRINTNLLLRGENRKRRP